MKFKKMMLIVIVLMTVMTIGAAGAADANQTSADDNGQETIGVSLDEEIISDNVTDGDVNTDISVTQKEGNVYMDSEETVVDVGVPEGTEGSIIVTVNENDFDWQIDEQFHGWFLWDLEITECGEYDVAVKYDDGESQATLSEAVLNVVEFNNDEFRAIIDYGANEVRVFCPEGSEGNIHITVERWDEDDYVPSDDFDYEITDDYLDLWTVFTFDELNVPIGTDSRISIDINDGQYFTSREGYAESAFGVWLWSEEDGDLFTDSNEEVVSIDLNRDVSGEIAVIVNEEEKDRREIDYEDNYMVFNLEDLDITEAGEYGIAVKFISEDGEEILGETTVNVIEFAYDTFRAVIDYRSKDVRFYCPEGAEGTVHISVWTWDDEAEDDVIVDEFDYEIDDSYYSQWTVFTFRELNVPKETSSFIRFEISDEQYSYSRGGYLGSFVWVDTMNVNDDGVIYLDNAGDVFQLNIEGEEATAEVYVNDVMKFRTLVYEEGNDGAGYIWNLKTLNITEPGTYDIAFKVTRGDEEEIIENTINAVEFANDTFRVIYYRHFVEDEFSDIYFFCPDGSTGTITIGLEEWADEEDDFVDAGEYTFEINSTMYNKWINILHELEGDYYRIDFRVDGEQIFVEERSWEDEPGFNILVNEWDNFLTEGNDVVYIDVPYDLTGSNGTFSIFSGNETLFSIKICELEGRPYEWSDGDYRYAVTLEDVNSFESLSDKDLIIFNWDIGGSMINGWLPYNEYVLQKTDEDLRLYHHEDLRVELVDISLIEDNMYRYYIIDDDNGDEDDEDEEPDDGIEFKCNIADEDAVFARVCVPDKLNITQTAVLHLTYGDHSNDINLTDLDWEYNYYSLAQDYLLTVGDLNPENLNDRDVINITLTSGDDLMGYRTIICFIGDDDSLGLAYFEYSIDLEFHFGMIGHSEFGMGESDGKLMILTVPDYLNVTEGAVQLIADNGTVLFSKSLSEFEEEYIEHGLQDTVYTILDDPEKFDYSCIPDGANFTVAFTYENTTLSFDKGTRTGEWLHKINTPANVDRLFRVTVAEGILCNGSETAIIIEARDDANRQSIYIDIGGGYFVVYVNGKKVENLGRLVRVDNETELELFRLCSNNEGFPKLYIYLSDINVTENGVYNIRVTHMCGDDDDNDDGNHIHLNQETELFNQNITLTSNVKANYQNETVRLFTGYGIDPVLLYLDTYYGDINETNGTITVTNSRGDRILSKNIKDLKYANGRYYLSYSDFEDNFGDNITVIYGNGNERDGETTLDVMWKDVDASDFAPSVNLTVEDYYSDFISMNIPDLINTGQIIVTVKFKNNRDANISNMNVTTDYDSHATYKFNVADIKTNYDNNTFALAFDDLGFYEINGDYDVLVQFTANGEDLLDIVGEVLDVELSDEITININDTSRYGMTLPFAGVRIYEPITAYGELYIDGELYSHKIFEKGIMVFESSASWAAGNHTAELIVCDAEFGTVLNSSSKVFETLTNTDDVNVSVDDNIRENESVVVTITVPKEGDASIVIDRDVQTTERLVAGDNDVDLGVLSHGNHTVWILYNVTLDDGKDSFYNNNLTFFVGDDGRWLSLPQPLVLNDDDTIRVDFPSDAEGYVVVRIDDRICGNATLVNGTAEVQITDSMFGDDKYGTHTYDITYSGDESHDSLSQTGLFNVTYMFKDDIDAEGYPLKEFYDINVFLPGDANGTVTVNAGGRNYMENVANGTAKFTVSNLVEGENPVVFSYSGDSTYPAGSYENILNVTYYAVIGDVASDSKYVSVMLPANATGSLIVYNDNRRSVLFTQQVINGRASVELNDLPVGIYEINAYYDGDDMDVRPFKGTFNVLPQVNITQDVMIGDNATISMDLNGASGNILVVVEGLRPSVQDIENGKMIYTFSTEDMSYGNRTINFQYFGTDFDGNVFYVLNESTGRYVPINYYINVLPKIVEVEMESNDNWAYISVGNATGTIEVFINGTKYAVLDIVDGIASLDLSGLSNGKYLVTWKYSGDDKYAPFSEDMILTINNTIEAADLKMLYMSKSKYSVKVCGTNGSALTGIPVTFIIDGVEYATVNTTEDGVAGITIKNKPGKYQITSKALGMNVTKKLTVKHIISLKKAKVKKSAKKLVLTAKIKKVNGKSVKGKKVTFKFNGKKYKAKTNKKGVAKVTIKKAVLSKLKAGKKVKYQATYKKDTVKRSVKVKK